MQLQYVLAETVYDLEGTAGYLGASGGYLGYGGVDIVSDTDERTGVFGDNIIGGQFGVGIDVHGTITDNKTLFSGTVDHFLREYVNGF